MHIKRLLSGSLAAMMVATSFNVPINVKAAEVPDTEPAAGLEENQELPSSDAEISLDDETNVVVEEAAEEPEVVAPEAEEETPTDELVVEEETAAQDVVGGNGTVTLTDGMITVPDNLVYNGGVLNVDVSVDVNGAEEGNGCTKDTDYTVSFLEGSTGNTEVTSIKNAGTYRAVVTPTAGSEVFSGETAVEKEFIVRPKQVTATIEDLVQTDSNEAVTPVIDFSGLADGDTLTADTDYSVVYKIDGDVTDLKTPGDVTAEITITNVNYAGNVTATFTISAPTEKVTITFDKNDGSDTPTTATQEVDKNTATAIDATPKGWTRAGYVLLGFNTDKDAKTASLATSANIPATEAAVTYYAIWEEVKTTISFNTNTAAATTTDSWTDGQKTSWNNGSGLTDQSFAEKTYKVSDTPVVSDLPYEVVAPTGFEFDSWVKRTGAGTEESPYKYEAISESDLKPAATATEHVSLTLYASYAPLDVKALKNAEFTVESFTYTGDAVAFDKIIKTATLDSKNIKNLVEVKNVYSKRTGEGTTDSPYVYGEADKVASEELKAAGTYYAEVEAKSGYSAKYTGKAYVEFTIAKRALTADDIAFVMPSDDNAVNKNADDATKIDSWNLYYETASSGEGETAKVKGVTGKAVEPSISVAFKVGEESKTVDSGLYSVEYADNKAVGTAKLTLKLEKTSTNFTAGTDGTLTKTFTIVDGKEASNADYGFKALTEADKAKLAETPTTGTATGYGPVFGKKVTRTIPAVDLAKIKVRGDRSDKVNVGKLTINGLYDTTGKLLDPKAASTKYTVTSVACKADGTVSTNAEENTYYKVTVAFNEATEYTGSYEIIEQFVKPVQNDSFTRQIDKASFDHPGKIYWANSTGKEAGVGDTITVDGQEVKLTEENKSTYIKEIPQLEKDFTIKDYDSTKGFEFKGTAVEPKVTLLDSNSTEIKESETTGEGDSAVTTTYYELKYEGNDKPNNAAKVTVVMKNELYEGSASKTFKIVEAKEELVAPTLRKLDGTIVYSANNYNLYYGDKLQLVSPTKDAKIYYKLSTTADFESYKPISASNYESGTLYKDTIELKEENAVVEPLYTGHDKIKISAIIVKNGCDPAVMDTIVVTVRNKWGDVDEQKDLISGWIYSDIPQNGLWISKASLNSIQNKDGSSSLQSKYLEYSGKAKEIPVDKLRVFFGTRLLTYKTDYTVKYANNVHASVTSGAKVPTITITGNGRYAGGFIQTFDIEPQTITPLTTPSTYDELTLAENGKIQTPKITAYDYVPNGSKYVKKNYVANKDYTVSYYDWQDSDDNGILDDNAPEITAAAGTKVAKVTMQGDYAGRAYVKYEVAAADKYLNKAKVVIDSSAVVFDGTDQAKNVVTTVKVDDVELVRGTDYEVQFNELANPNTYFVSEIKTAGKYVVKIVPKDGSLYKGYKEVNYTFKGGIDITKAANVRIEGTEKKVEWVAEGTRFSNLKLTQTARIDGAEKPMYEDTDYIAIYSTATNNAVGKATLTLIGQGKYTGTKNITFEVTPKYTLNKNDITVESLVYRYDSWNTTINDLANKVDINDGSGLDGDGKVANDDITFAYSSKDDFANGDKVKVYYATKDMANAGTKKLTVEGNPAQGYKGKVTVNFTIEPFDLDEDQKKIDKDTPENSTNVVEFSAFGYAGKIYPYVEYKYEDTESGVKSYQPLTTKEINNNFTVKYSTKKFNAGTEGIATFTPKAKKNFKGSPIQVEYTINTVSISRNMIVINDQGTNDKTTKFGKGVAPVVTFGGTKLKANTDYTVEYFYNVDAAGTHARFEKPAPTDIMKAGTIITCRITGKGNYDGTVNVDYKYVLSTNLATNAKLVQKTKKVYEGSPVTLEAGTDFDITLGTDTTKDAKGKTVKTPHVLTTEQYKVVSVTNNEKPGTAKVTIALSGEYGGTKTFNFKIDKKSMDYRVEFAVGVVPTGATVTGKTAAMTSKTSTFKSLPTSGFTVSKKEGKTTTKYAFAGWFTDAACTQAVATPIGKAYETDIAPGATKTLYAKYVAPSEYTITFDANGGTKAKESAVVTQKIAIGAKKALQANPFVKTGYKFEGWDTESAGNNVVYKNKEQVVNVTTGTAVTLKAVWSPITYKITYKNVDTKAETFYGPLQAAKVIADPTKAGYTFEGWKVEIKGQKAETGKKAYSIPKDTAADVTLTAAWKAKEVTINFTNAETLKDPSKFVASTKVDAGKKVTLPKLVAANEEKVFVGWKNGDTVYKGGTQQAFASESAVALTSVWADKKYTITYVLDGGRIEASSYPTAFTKATAATTTLPTVTKFGYSFAKWELVEGSKATDLTDGKLPADTAKNVKVRPVWEENKSNLVITLKPGTGADAVQSDQPVTIYPGGAANINNSFTRKNYDFAGWQATGLPETTYDDKAVISNNGDGTADKTATLTATWTKHNYIVNYDLNGATNTENASWLYDEGSRKTFVYKVGEPLTLETAPVRKGYTFVGWYNGTYDEKNPDTNKVTEIAVNTAEGAAASTDVTVKAQWKAIDYTATLTLNGGKLADSIVATDAAAGKWVYDNATTPTVATQKYTINGSVTLPTPVKENYTFNGWFTDSDFTEGNEITSIPVGTAKNTTVYAKFTENKKVTITFDANEGTGESMTAQVIYSGKSANLSENKYTKDGFTFAGWKVTSVDGKAVTGNAETYADKGSFSAGTLTADKAVTLTAQWTAVTP